MIIVKKFSFLLLLLILNSFIFSNDLENINILEKVDEYRNFSDNGFSFDCRINEDTLMEVYVKRGDEKSVIVVYREPKKFHRRKIFSSSSSFWLMDSNMSSAIKISASQMLSGDASSGDITNLTFSRLYNLNSIGEDEKNYILDLEIKESKTGNYPHIKLTVDRESYKMLSAKLYSRTNALLKIIDYTAFVEVDGKTMLSEFVITNPNNGSKTHVKMDNYRESTISDRYFSKEGIKLLK